MGISFRNRSSPLTHTWFLVHQVLRRSLKQEEITLLYKGIHQKILEALRLRILSESARQTQYQMEKSSTSPKLAIFTKPPMPKCEYRLSDVKEGFEYQFHVAAINETGTSPPRRVRNRAGKSGGQTFCPPTGQIRQRHGLTAPFPTLPHS